MALLMSTGSTAHPHSGSTSEDSRFHQIGSRLSRRGDPKNDYVSYAISGLNQLNVWYNTSNGLWDKTWWPSANIVTQMADFQEIFPSEVSSMTEYVFPNTLAQAPAKFSGFLNDFYDDQLWWALAWIRVFDVTKNITYLETAAKIFDDSKQVWGQTPCSGLWWDKKHTEVGAVVNELYFTTASKLANRMPSDPSPGYYLEEAMKAFTWFRDSGLINEQNLINNALDLKTCTNDGNYVFSYNQGIILSGLVELTWATNDNQYADLAHTLASAAIGAMTDSEGILHEPCETGWCNSDMEQFKGIFSRNLHFLYNRDPTIPEDKAILYKDFLQRNANSIWVENRADNRLGLVWSGPRGTVTVRTHSSALDTIIGAASVS
ncbi:hypothetical protein K3495_g9587 [Podosphaera aphanis]|nr:hypothetical protein K3495_g9587 [Podosphaera aphanis]